MKWILPLAVLFLTIDAYAVEKFFFPKNDLYIGVDDKYVTNVSEAEFDTVLNRVIETYKPVVEKRGGSLKLEPAWYSGYVNASARRSGDKYIVTIYGGLARHQLMTIDALALVVCHEMGHLVGGAPKMDGYAFWASAEGQADYFSTAKCFKRVFEDDDNDEIMKNVHVPSVISRKCAQAYSNLNMKALCRRAAVAGIDLAKLLSSLGSGVPTVDVNSPDESKIKRTTLTYPSDQCRLDSYFAGAVCNNDFTQETDDNDPNYGFCSRRDGTTLGTRPRCWYNPEDYN